MNEARFCYVNLQADQSEEAKVQGCSADIAFAENQLENYQTTRGVPFLSLAIFDESMKDFAKKTVSFFNKFIEEKTLILE